jgi:uncharacterized protein (DUF1684 family)
VPEDERVASSRAPGTWEQSDGSATDRAWLADWRRRVAALYAEVRAMAATDPGIALAHWRAVRELLYREHPQSPVPLDARAGFTADHFPHDPSLRFEVVLEPAPPPAPGGLGLALELPNSGADTLAFARVGRVTLPFDDRPRSLSVFWMAGYSGGLFIPFRDATNGTETYGAGRYLLDTVKGADLGTHGAQLVLDFNFAYNPSCAYDPRWSCPLAPQANRLPVEVRAGERLA